MLGTDPGKTEGILHWGGKGEGGGGVLPCTEVTGTFSDAAACRLFTDDCFCA